MVLGGVEQRAHSAGPPELLPAVVLVRRDGLQVRRVVARPLVSRTPHAAAKLAVGGEYCISALAGGLRILEPRFYERPYDSLFGVDGHGQEQQPLRPSQGHIENSIFV